MGTPAAIRARVEPHTEAWEVEPLELKTSLTQPVCIGELFHRGDHGQKSSLCQSAMANFPAAGAAAGLGLSHRVGGEIILMHIAFEFFLVDAVQHLLVAYGPKVATVRT